MWHHIRASERPSAERTRVVTGQSHMICQVEEESSKQMKLFSDEEPKQVVQALKQTYITAGKTW